MTPSCTLHIPTETLSGWYDDMLAPPETWLLNEHVPTCADCQTRMQHFHDIHDILVRQPQLMPSTRIRDHLQRHVWQRGVPAALRPRSIVNGVAASILLVLVVALFFVLLGNHQPGILTPMATATAAHTTALPTITATTISHPTATAKPTTTAQPTIPTTPPTGITGTWQSLQSGSGNTASYCYILTITSAPAAGAITGHLATAQPTCASAIIGGFPMSGTFDGATLNLHEVISASAFVVSNAPLAFVHPTNLQGNCGDTTYFAFYSASPQSLVGDLTVCSVATPITFTRAT